MTKRRLLAGIGVVAAIIAAITVVHSWRTHRAGNRQIGTPIQQIRSGDLTVVLLSPTGTLHQGRNTFAIEFRRGNDALVDVGAVRMSGNMAMPGMAMSGGVGVSRTAVPGRYQVTAEFGMAGEWQMAIEWDGPAGRGSVNLEGTVR